MEPLYEFLAKGGVLMIPILGCSVIALTLFLQRTWALQRTRILPRRLMALVLELLDDGKASEAETLCGTNSSAVAQLAVAGLRRRGRPRSVVREALEETGRREVSLLGRYVGGLGTIASISPLLGLLGTVAGMIRVFKQVVDEVAVHGHVNPGALANGIWEALITTAAGLSVAIPTYIAYRYLESRIDRIAVEMEEYALGLADHLAEDATGAPAAEEAAP